MIFLIRETPYTTANQALNGNVAFFTAAHLL